jgi:methyl-accepting chemotaxis protein
MELLEHKLYRNVGRLERVVKRVNGERISSFLPHYSRLFAGFRRSRGKNETAAQWENRLHELIHDLESFVASMEEEFLSMGAKLHGLHQNVKKISRLSFSVAGLLAGDEITNSVAGLQAILNRIKELESSSRHRVEVLKHILDSLDKIGSTVESFNNVMRTLNVLCVTVKIENARFNDNDTGFDTLAKDIKGLAQDIESKFTNIINEISVLRLQIQETLGKASDIETRRHDQGRVILDRILSNLSSLLEKRQFSSSAANKISACYEDISRSIGQIVTSIQFHDITRQRFEHVEKALKDIVPLLDFLDNENNKDAEHTESHGADSTLIEIDGICEIQSVQLRSAKEQLEYAVSTIVQNLRETAQSIAGMSEDTRGLAGATDESGQSFLSEVENGLSSITAVLSEYTEVNRRLSIAMHSVAATILNMSVFVKEIDRIGGHIKLIALNAIVKAAHIGEDGAALEVLAEDVHRLSLGTLQKTVAISEAFKEITSAAEGLALSGDGNDKDKSDCRDKTAEELRSLIGSLRSVNENIISILVEMDEAGKGIAGNIGETIAEINVHERAVPVISAITSGLGAMGEQCRALAPDTARLGRSEVLKALEASYTMQCERVIHQSALEPDVSYLPEEIASCRESQEMSSSAANAGDSDEELGDNVELF